jgi:glycerol-3-phosphate cytidylyltransferase
MTKKITGFVAGCFDLIHPGYIYMFEDAKTVCNHLIVALHEDPSHERPQKYKPLHTLEERATILKSIKYVDEIVYYKTEEELENLLLDLKPNYRILGTDYLDKDYTGKGIKDIEIYFHERKHNWSYSNLRRKIC